MKKLNNTKHTKKKNYDKIINKRLIFFIGLIVFLFSIIVVRFYIVMVHKNSEYKERL